MTTWFKRSSKPIDSERRLNIPDGVWMKCEACGEIIYRKDIQRNFQVCPHCGHHYRISSADYCSLLLDEGGWVEQDENLTSADPLEFKDTMRYSDRVAQSNQKTGMKDAVKCVTGEIEGRTVQAAVMDFAYMGGSVGSVVGEKLVRAINRAIDGGNPLITVSCSGGMRMQEGAVSLMQMAKVSAALVLLDRKKLPFISILTNPTTGGTTASFSMLGDVIIAEPKALIGFAGPRVIKQTIGQDLPEGFQSSEFLLEHGFIDLISPRVEMRKTVAGLLDLLMIPRG